MINNRQNGRRRGRGGQRPQGGSSQGQRDNGNRIDSRARGNASQLYEKYKNMASDAQRQGDRVNTEYYLQFADHYFRVLADQRGRYEDQQPRRQQNDFDGDDDYGDEGEPIRADEQGRGGDERGERDGNRGDGNRGEGRGESRQQEGRQSEARQFDGGRPYDGSRQRDGGRQEGGRQFDRQRPADGNRQRDDNRQADAGRERQARYGDADDGEQRAAAPARRFATPRGDEGRRDERVMGEGGVESAAPGREAELQVHGGNVPVAEEAAPKRRGRPRKIVASETQFGLDSSVLPPSIGTSEPAVAGDAADTPAAPKPRRRRTPASAPETSPETSTVS
ncbi:DUF4167 domain-containing protein [Sphingomonas sp. NBWT7]|uniref:DUF4167 domain-containing protein n=1 Tax=Sphingomonas sp. NBWT7 TaxID=2596913 RepID=UPI00162344E0|nr:DUF4167 domain-containing protein [Sphingomonas sp. NBWT7]QNE32919.1 DUF4167 domain-containing protein [Sphingomonas sp. NBWT7]